MKLTLRYMTEADIPQVMEIDRLSFELPWAERSYEYEIQSSQHSYMTVLEQTADAASGWRRWLDRLNGRRKAGRIVGYGGMWRMGKESHISTIAVHPNWRGRGYGEILLAGMVGRAISLMADFVVLEVRVSNTRAQNLYLKYDFQMMYVKERYYRNNDEDAYEMHLRLDVPENRDLFAAHYADLCADVPFDDRFSGGRM